MLELLAVLVTAVWLTVLTIELASLAVQLDELRRVVVSAAGRCSANRDWAGEGEGARARVMRVPGSTEADQASDQTSGLG